MFEIRAIKEGEGVPSAPHPASEDHAKHDSRPGVETLRAAGRARVGNSYLGKKKPTNASWVNEGRMKTASRSGGESERRGERALTQEKSGRSALSLRAGAGPLRTGGGKKSEIKGRCKGTDRYSIVRRGRETNRFHRRQGRGQKKQTHQQISRQNRQGVIGSTIESHLLRRKERGRGCVYIITGIGRCKNEKKVERKH